MNFQPYSEEEVARNAWPSGEYDYEFVTAESKRSKAGNDMIELKVKVWDSTGKSQIVKDWFLGTREGAHKLRHACYSCGMGHNYEMGDVDPEDFKGKSGRLKLGIEKSDAGYPDKNVIRDYVVAETTKRQEGYQQAKTTQSLKQPPQAKAAAASPIGNKEEFAESEIPF